MALQFEYDTVATHEEAQQVGRIDEQCFIAPSGSSAAYLNRLGQQNFRVIRQQGRIAGGLTLISMGQWWGGQRVSMTGIASVGIAPEYRGSGAAIALMQNALQELYANGTSISVLYPATQRLYRKVGYEQAGSSCRWVVNPSTIQIKEQCLRIDRLDPIDPAWLHSIQQQQAKQNNGNLDRHPALWQEIVKFEESSAIYGYSFGTPEQSQGYVLFNQQRTETAAILRIKDWAVLTPAAAKSFWMFLANHRSQITAVEWKGAAIDPLALLLPEQTIEPKSIDRWFLRVVNVPNALEQRGYTTTVKETLQLEVKDDLLPENHGKFILSVEQGQGKVTPGGTGELKLDIRALAPLYTGFLNPYQLQAIGYLEASASALEAASQIFAGMPPWMPDFF